MRWRTVGLVALTALVGLAAAVAVAAAGIGDATEAIYPPRDGDAPPALAEEAAVPARDPEKPTAVIVLGTEVAYVADVLAPFEVLADTGAFTVCGVVGLAASPGLRGETCHRISTVRIGHLQQQDV